MKYLHRSAIRFAVALFVLLAVYGSPCIAKEPIVLNVWPDKPPGETKELPPEGDQTKEDGNLVAGKRVIRIGNVSTPQIAVHQPVSAKANGAAVVICPGGGHHILAYDLEGTEVADWLNSIGVTAIVLKYRVPFRDPKPAPRWRAAVQDAQRSMSLVRSKADQWKIDPNRIGICGFSAGGETAALTSLFFDDLKYEPIDEIDKISNRPDFAMLIYPAYLADDGDQPKLREHIKVTDRVPPMFFAHAFDDRVTVQSSLLLASKVKSVGGTADLHVYSHGGHGYGLRRTDEPVTSWPDRAEEWMRRMTLLEEALDEKIKKIESPRTR